MNTAHAWLLTLPDIGIRRMPSLPLAQRIAAVPVRSHSSLFVNRLEITTGFMWAMVILSYRISGLKGELMLTVPYLRSFLCATHLTFDYPLKA